MLFAYIDFILFYSKLDYFWIAVTVYHVLLKKYQITEVTVEYAQKKLIGIYALS